MESIALVSVRGRLCLNIGYCPVDHPSMPNSVCTMPPVYSRCPARMLRSHCKRQRRQRRTVVLSTSETFEDTP